MFNIDLHIHTQRYSPCAEFMDPYRLAPVARQCGLHGVLLTEHDAVWSSREIAKLQRQLGNLRVYRGCEVSTFEGHVIVVGIRSMRGIRRGMHIQQLTEMVKRRGGASILVHPFRPSGESGSLDHQNLPREISAVEVMNATTDRHTEALTRKLANRYGFPIVAGSDAHAVDQVGIVHTTFEKPPMNERELASAIRKGEGCPERFSVPISFKLKTSIQ